MLRLQVREIRAWLSGGNQDFEVPSTQPYPRRHIALDAGAESRGDLDSANVVADDEPIVDTPRPQPTPSH